MPAPTIRSRIKSLRHVLASDLKASPKNWRVHPEQQKKAMSGILAQVGYADALIARELPDGTLMLIDGHLRAETTPDQKVPVLIVDLTEEEADVVLATLDPLAAMAETDGDAIRALMGNIAVDDEAVSKMLEELTPFNGGDEEPPGAGIDITEVSIHSILIENLDEEKQRVLLEELVERGLQCKALIF